MKAIPQLLSFLFLMTCSGGNIEVGWPELTNEHKPWTRWWWHGSSVTAEGITHELEEIKAAGIGGVEITPIYGVIGEEDSFIQYLSNDWMEMLVHTLTEAERLDLGVDMATGTGWPFGGPWVSADNAPRNVVHKIYQLKEGETLTEPVRYLQEPLLRAVTNQLYQLYGLYRVQGENVIGSIKEPPLIDSQKSLNINQIKFPISSNDNLQGLALDQVKFGKQLPLVALMAYGQQGNMVDLIEQVDETGHLNWQAPPGKWTLVAVFIGNHGKMVERAAPGGEGNTIDHFSEKALSTYLSKFDTAFSNYDISSLRAFFNDSYEVDDASGSADWTPLFFDEFLTRRGYDLRKELLTLFGESNKERHSRVLCDYRATVGELILERFTEPWSDWASGQQAITRNQAHGSPANILDLYAAVGIPETEGTDLISIKLASSASNVAGKKLSSSESATWLDEHFTSSLADIKRNLERYILGGVNHVFYHGTCYSPQHNEWPGRLFYAAVHANSRNPWWDHFGALNRYIERVQSFMQQGDPANDILLYLPMYDLYSQPGPELLMHFHLGRGAWSTSTANLTGDWLQQQGFSFDFISDRQIQDLQYAGGELQSHGRKYKALLIPPCENMPLATLKKLMTLAKEGTTVIFQDALPKDIPGLHALEDRRKEFRLIIDQNAHYAPITGELENTLKSSGIEPEPMVSLGLDYIRRRHTDGYHYFIVNNGETDINEFIPLSQDAASVVLFNPSTGDWGNALWKNHEVLLQLAIGESCIISTYDSHISTRSFPYYEVYGNPSPLKGPWTLSFVRGGPELPESQNISSLVSWTEFEGDLVKRFSGTASYQTTFPRPQEMAEAWLLDLGTVHQSARVILNDRETATLVGPEFRLKLPGELLKEENTLEIQISNLMANRISHLDREDVFWKKFYNVNFPARLAENRVEGLFDASHWDPLPSGLLGPVTLTPLSRIE